MAEVAKNKEFELNIGEAVEVPKRKMVTIFIDEEKGKPNYEVVGVNGKMYQIQRGVDVEVPEEVVHVLNNAIATRYVKTVNRTSGLEELVPQNYLLTPFRVIRN